MSKIGDKWQELKRYYAATGFRVSFGVFIFGMLFLSLIAAGISVLAIPFLPADLQQYGFIVSATLFVAFASFIISIPITYRNNRITAIESNLPDALKHMAAVLRAGGTVENALEEVASSDYGPLSVDLKVALRQLREGRNFDDVLTDVALNSGSPVFRRLAIIIVDARKAGAGLAAVMDAIADDSRETLRIQRERVSRTTMPVMFLLISALFLAPLIFGFAMGVVANIGGGLSTAGAGGGTQVLSPALLSAYDPGLYLWCSLLLVDLNQPVFQLRNVALTFLLAFFLIFLAVISNIGIGLIREGKATAFILYAPIMVAVALGCFIGGLYLSRIIAGTA
ncbi:MAG TPA: type II secretion system F family protein [Candidatus Norongarragalinales archaeon]|jgi:Flp pilus assembly protein TadB|nr:type II secretion system F family protein [Candidatus Norongarragalinales archaeon]